MAADVHGKRKSTTRIMSSDKHGRGKKGKGRQAHRKDAGVLGEAEGGPDRLDFAGDRRGRSRRGRCCSRSWLDSLNGDDAVDDADVQDASAWRRVYYNNGASAAMATVVSGAVFQSGTCR
jgi:hypothetical protein